MNTNTQISKTTLQPIYVGIRSTQTRIIQKTQSFYDHVIYDIVEQGLWFLKAKQAVGHGNFERIFESDTVAELNISVRTAQRYMTAATNAGLTHESDPQQVQRMSEAMTLHGTKPTELYKSPKPVLHSGEREEQRRGQQMDLLNDLFRDFCESTSTLVQRRDQVDPETYKKIEAELYDALCKWSDCDWEPRERGSHKDGSNLPD